MEVTDRRALSVSRFIDQCGVCRVVAPVDFLVVCSCLGHTRIFFVWFSWVDAVIIQRARERAHRQIQRKDATEDILDSDQYGRHSRGMQRRYRGEYDYFHSLLSPFCHFFDNRSIVFSVMSCYRLASSVLKWYFVRIHRTRVPASIRTRFADSPVYPSSVSSKCFRLWNFFIEISCMSFIDASRSHTYSLLRTCLNFKQQHHDAIWSWLFTLYFQLQEFVYSFYRNVCLMR